MGERIKPSGPELSKGVPLADLPDNGVFVGQVQGEPVLLVRRGDEVSAVAAACSHYGASLADGIVVGDEIRCPWHHACFDVRTGEATGPPALTPIDTWEVVRDGRRVVVGARRASPASAPAARGPASVVVVGAGAVGDAVAEGLRRGGYQGPITLVSRDAEPRPVDRTNLSKDYLAGEAPEAWLWLRTAEFYEEQQITLRTGAEVAKIEPEAHRITLADGQTLDYGALVLATGASPVRLDIPGRDLSHVFTLRTEDDARRIIARLGDSKRAVVLGSSFIGLEAAASLRARGLKVHVVSPDTLPLSRVLGPELGRFVKELHEEHGVTFHLGRKPSAITDQDVTLDDGSRIEADLVVMGVGVRPNTALAEAAGLRVDRGVLVDEYFRTSAPDVYAAGDIARYPAGDGTQRIEHWVVAQQQGQAVARTLLGQGEPFRAVPFFWSQHYDVPVNYVGHAESWDSIQIAGNLTERNCLVAYRREGKILAVASIYRDRDSLQVEEAFARGDQDAVERIMASVD